MAFFFTSSLVAPVALKLQSIPRSLQANFSIFSPLAGKTTGKHGLAFYHFNWTKFVLINLWGFKNGGVATPLAVGLLN
jgi:hypothetical protein